MYHSIALIDNIIDQEKMNLRNIDIIKLDDNDNNVVQSISYSENQYNINDHATVCAGIIRKYAADAKIINIPILDNLNLNCSISKLINAIKWCIKNKIGIICLSVGSVNLLDYEEMLHICETAFINNIVIVAALNNNNKYTLPASLPNVIGVKKNIKLKEKQYIITHDPFTGIDIEACCNHLIQYGRSGSFCLTETCNSYAAPFIAAKIYNIFLRYNFSHIRKEEIINLLKKDAYSFADNKAFFFAYKNNELVISTYNNEIINFDTYDKAISIVKYRCPDRCLKDIPIISISPALYYRSKYVIDIIIKKLVEEGYFISVISDKDKNETAIKNNSILIYPYCLSKIDFINIIGYTFSPDILISLSNGMDIPFDVCLQYDNDFICFVNKISQAFSISDAGECADYLIALLKAGV